MAQISVSWKSFTSLEKAYVVKKAKFHAFCMKYASLVFFFFSLPSLLLVKIVGTEHIFSSRKQELLKYFSIFYLLSSFFLYLPTLIKYCQYVIHSRLKCLGGVPVLWSKWPLASSLQQAIKTCRQACPPGYLMHFS